MIFCFKFRGRRICIWIPLLIRDVFKKPEPDPRVDSFLVEHDLISKEIEHDLRALATLHAVAGELSADLRRPLQGALENALKTLQGKMPEDVTVEFQDIAKGSRK